MLKSKKPTEDYDQLLVRFTKRTAQLELSQTKIVDAHLQWIELDKQLNYLRGCIDTIEYLKTGKLPDDGNHTGMANHKPSKHNDLGSLD
tara:strand:- start:1378 stop:1644 length:267 start_codon:yes stop_codon:yes gene_type:complete